MRLILPLPGNEAFAARLAAAAGAELGKLETRRFPDGESYVRLHVSPAGRVVDLVCTLARPDEVFLPLVFAADAARELGAAAVNLIAPYLAYMRQDARFKSGEAISSRSFARLLSGAFDRLVTLDPHLHRHPDLSAIYSIPCHVLHAAPLLADWIRENVRDPLVVGPDSESEQWASEVARRADAPHVVLRKQRLGDRQVKIGADDLGAYRGRRPVLIDDIAASGRTLIAAAGALRAQGFAAPICVVVHAVFGGDAYERLSEVAERVVATDAVPHPSNAISVAPLFAKALQESRDVGR